MEEFFREIFIEGVKKYGAEIVYTVLICISIWLFPRLRRFLAESLHDIFNKPEPQESYKSATLEDMSEEDYSTEMEQDGGKSDTVEIPEWMSKKRKEFAIPFLFNNNNNVIKQFAIGLGAYVLTMILYGIVLFFEHFGYITKNSYLALSLSIILFWFIMIIRASKVKTYITAAERGHADSQYQIGKLYYRRRNYKLAYMWFYLAYLCGHQKAREQFRAMESGGLFFGAKVSPGQAAEPMNEARKMYDEIKRNLDAAFQYYRAKSWKGDSISQYNLGYVYQHGEGVQQDYYSAYVWYYVAMLSGVWGAKSRLKQIENKLFPPQIAQAKAEAKRKFNAIQHHKVQN